MAFKKGKSGNPNGRPKGRKDNKTLEIEAICRKKAPKAIKALENLINDPKHPAHFAATQEVLNRAYGKPKQVQQHIGDKDNPVEINHTSAADAILKKLADIAGRKVG